MSNTNSSTVFYRTLNVEGLEIFYREAGPEGAPTILLLHGFPSSSHQYRDLICELADNQAQNRLSVSITAATPIAALSINNARKTVDIIHIGSIIGRFCKQGIRGDCRHGATVERHTSTKRSVPRGAQDRLHANSSGSGGGQLVEGVLRLPEG